MLWDNPVLQRELLVNLRRPRAFWLLLGYVAALCGLVYLSWPEELGSRNPEGSRRLVDLFFLGQYTLAFLMVPSFAAGAISGEKEAKTYEMLLASPLKPASILLGKFLGSICHLGVLIFSSLPIAVVCLPWGGTSIYEVLAAYLGLYLIAGTLGMVCLASSAYFRRTVASLLVAYVLMLPIAGIGLWLWSALGGGGAELRLLGMVTVVPGMAVAVGTILFFFASGRLLHPPDVGSEGNEVIDDEPQQAVSLLVIRRDKFPDRLFAPAKRADVLDDNANPVFDKEMRSDIFSQGTLMLRIVIQASLFVAIPLMAGCLILAPQNAPWYVSYVVLFNLFIGPAFTAGSMTSERERGTLVLLLTTTLRPGQIVWGKLLSSMRVTTVLTALLLWPMAIACVVSRYYWDCLPTLLAYLAIIVVACATTATVGLFFSVLVRTTTLSLMASYLALLLLYVGPIAVAYFASTFYSGGAWTSRLDKGVALSPFSAAFSLPLDFSIPDMNRRGASWPIWLYFLGLHVMINVAIIAAMSWIFDRRWRVAT